MAGDEAPAEVTSCVRVAQIQPRRGALSSRLFTMNLLQWLLRRLQSSHEGPLDLQWFCTASFRLADENTIPEPRTFNTGQTSLVIKVFLPSDLPRSSVNAIVLDFMECVRDYDLRF